MSDIADVRRSFDRAREHGFATKFYEKLLAADPAIAKRFARTDLGRQRELLVHGVYSILDYADGRALGKLAIDRLAHLHEPGRLAIPPSMYTTWANVFAATLRATDPELDDTLASAWRAAIDRTVSVMVAAYEKPVPKTR